MPLPLPIIGLLVASAGVQFAKSARKWQDKQARQGKLQALEDYYGIDTSSLSEKERKRIATGDPFMDILASGGQSIVDFVGGSKKKGGGSQPQQARGEQPQQSGSALGLNEAMIRNIPLGIQLPGATGDSGAQPQQQPRQRRRSAIVAEGTVGGQPAGIAPMEMQPSMMLPPEPVQAPVLNPQLPVEMQGLPPGVQVPGLIPGGLGGGRPQVPLASPTKQVSTRPTTAATAPTVGATAPSSQSPSIAAQIASQMPVGGELELDVPGGGVMKFAGGEAPGVPSNLEEALTQAYARGDQQAIGEIQRLIQETDPNVKNAEALYAQAVQLYGPDDPRTQDAFGRLMAIKSASATRVGIDIKQPNAQLTGAMLDSMNQLGALQSMIDSRFWEYTGVASGLSEPIRRFFGMKPSDEVTADTQREMLNTMIRLANAGTALTEIERREIQKITVPKTLTPEAAYATAQAIWSIAAPAYQRQIEMLRQAQEGKVLTPPQFPGFSSQTMPQPTTSPGTATPPASTTTAGQQKPIYSAADWQQAIRIFGGDEAALQAAGYYKAF